MSFTFIHKCPQCRATGIVEYTEGSLSRQDLVFDGYCTIVSCNHRQIEPRTWWECATCGLDIPVQTREELRDWVLLDEAVK